MFGSTPAFGGYSQSQADVPMDATQGSPQNGQPSGDGNTLMPVTILMLEKAIASQVPGGDLKVDGHLANMMIVVAAVEELNRQQTSMEFVLNDSTGRMKARFFFSPDLNFDKIHNGSYVSAAGILKIQPSLHFSVVALHPVHSADQISYHAIEVVHSSMRRKGKMANKKGQDVAAVPRPMVSTASPAAPTVKAASVAAPRGVESGSLRNQIAAFLSSTQNQELGVAFGELTNHFKGAASDAIRAALNELLDDGTAYTTIDDDHFAAV